MTQVAIIGAGIVGLASAYELQQRGFEVSVYEANAQSGQGTSKANGAQLSYSFVTPLATPGVLRDLPKLLFDRQGALRLHPRLQMAQLRWLLAFTACCTQRQSRQGAEDLFLLGQLSRQSLDELLAEHPLPFAHRRSGKLQVFQSQSGFEQARAAQTDFLATHGIEQQVLNAAETIQLEPSLAAIEGRIQGSLFTPSEETGDCAALCAQMTQLLQKRGVKFHFNTPITSLQAAGNQVRAQTAQGPLEHQHIVLATGVPTQQLLRPLGLNPNIYPLRGYSLTFPLNEDSQSPRTSISDIKNKVVYAPLGKQLRVAGMVDIGVQRPRIIEQRINTLKAQVNEFYPQLAPAGPPTSWTGERAARPDSKPVISATPYANLHVNAGHGALGFTLAFGSARLLAGLLCGDADPTLAQRFVL